MLRGGHHCFRYLDRLCRWYSLDEYMESLKKGDLVLIIDCVSDRKTHGVSAVWILGMRAESEDDGELIYFSDLLSSNNKLEIASVVDKVKEIR